MNNLKRKKPIKNILLLILITLILVVTTYSIITIFNNENLAPEESFASKENFMDERFSAGGLPNANKLGIRWVYNWGFESRDASRLKGLTHSEHKVMPTIGSVELFQDECPIDSTDPQKRRKPAYDSAGIPTCGGYDRIQLIADTLHSEGQDVIYWAIGNEQDFNTFVEPDEYAKWYKAFADRIIEVDPNAKISIGGIYFTRYRYENRKDATWDWRTDLFQNDPFFQNMYTNAVSAKNNGNPTEFEIIDMNAWVYYFYKKYESINNGEKLKIHWWNIHAYPRWYHNDPTKYNIDDAINETKGEIDSFREFMQFIGDENKPLIVTETAILEPPEAMTCSGIDDCTMPGGSGYNTYQANVDRFLPEIIEYLTTPNSGIYKVQRWHWFSLTGTKVNWPTAMIVDSTGKKNSLAQKYSDLGFLKKDIDPPNDLSINISNSGNTYTVELSAKDTLGSNQSGLIEYWYSVGTSEGGNEFIGNDRNTGYVIDLNISNRHNISIQIPNDDKTYYINFKAKDAAGNLSDTTTKTLKTGTTTKPSNTTVPSTSPTLEISNQINTNETQIICDSIDANNDNSVGIEDFPHFKNSYLKFCSETISESTCGSIDSDANGIVDIIDLKNFIEKYNLNDC